MFGPPVLPRRREFWEALGKDHWAKAEAAFKAYAEREAAAVGMTVEEWNKLLAEKHKVVVDPHVDPAEYGL